MAEAEIVISAGRGLKGPENWGMIEELADLLKAGTACSKPVSDITGDPMENMLGKLVKQLLRIYISLLVFQVLFNTSLVLTHQK